MTLTEVLVVVVVLSVLAMIFLAALQNSHSHRSKIYCVNNLKQIGLAYRIWAGDNNDVFPMGISVTNGGTLELVRAGNVAATFQVMSNELSTPKILICAGDGYNPGDRIHKMANDFSALSNSNISYFVGVDVTNDANPLLIGTGDSNLQIAGKTAKSGLLSVWTNAPVAWDTTRHPQYGNLGLSDGSVQSVTASLLKNSLIQTGVATNRFAIP